jgi:hypothetical protein
LRGSTTEVDCEFQVVLSAAGDQLLSLATFGSESRKETGTASQKVDLDERMAGALMEVILDTFPNLRSQALERPDN